MAQGPSGRIVIEVDPDLKRRLYAALSLDGTTLKAWFVHQAEQYLASANQLPLDFHGPAKPMEPPETGPAHAAPTTRRGRTPEQRAREDR